MFVLYVYLQPPPCVFPCSSVHFPCVTAILGAKADGAVLDQCGFLMTAEVLAPDQQDWDTGMLQLFPNAFVIACSALWKPVGSKA